MINGSRFLGTDDDIKESLEFGLCVALVLEDSYEETLRTTKDASLKLRRQEETVANEKRIELARVAAEKKAAEDRKSTQELARIMAQYRKAVDKELSQYRFFVAPLTTGASEDEGLSISVDDGSILLFIHYESTEGMVANFRDRLQLLIESIILDFQDPEIPDFIIKAETGRAYRSDISIGNPMKMTGLDNFLVSFDYQNRLTQDQRALFVSKFGTGGFDTVHPPRTSFSMKLRVRGLRTFASKPYEFECRNFELLEKRGLCFLGGERHAYFNDPIVVNVNNAPLRSSDRKTISAPSATEEMRASAERIRNELINSSRENRPQP